MALSTEPASAATVVLQGGIVTILLMAARRRNGAAVVNAFAAFAATLFPLAAEVAARAALARSVSVGPELPLWIAVAGILHAYGMLGPYDSIWWWDLLTHTVSAALVAALVYAALLVAQATGDGGLVAGRPGAWAVAFTLAAGVFWELVELVAREAGERFDVDPVLVHYGWRDTALDLVVDAAAAIVIVLADVRVFVPVVEQVPGATRTLFAGSTAVIVVGSVAMSIGVAVSRR